MKITCDMALDLMPLYIDNEASPDSKAAIEEHLSACPDCKRYFKSLKSSSRRAANGDLPGEPDSLETVMIRASRKIKKNIILFAFTALIFSAICSFLSILITASKYRHG